MVKPSGILNGKILIVDDQQVNLSVLERMLRGAGYLFITSTTNPAEVRELHQRHQYDLILLDFQMPALNGFQVMEGLREIETGGYLPVLMITADPSQKLAALRAGAKDFISKPLDLAEVLARVHNMLEVRLLHLETKILYDELVTHQTASEQLLLNVLPQFIADRLKERPELIAEGFNEVVADRYPEATVLFAGIVDFTAATAALSPADQVGILNHLFADFDRITRQQGMDKIKTIGGAYLCVAGLHGALDHAMQAARAALDMLRAMDHYNLRAGRELQLRIGIQTGPVVAGVIGTRNKFIYDIWGDAVTTASRLESSGVAGCAQMGGSTRAGLDASFPEAPCRMEEHGGSWILKAG